MTRRLFVLPERGKTRRQTLKPWSSSELSRLRQLAESGVALATIATDLRRTVAAIRNKATMHGISLTRVKAAT